MAATHVLGVPLLAVGEALALGGGGLCCCQRNRHFLLHQNQPRAWVPPKCGSSRGARGLGWGCPFPRTLDTPEGSSLCHPEPSVGLSGPPGLSGILSLQGASRSGHLPPRKSARPRNPRTTELLPAHGSSRPRYQGALCCPGVQPSSLLSLSLSLPLREPLGQHPARAHPLPCCHV